MIVLLIGVVVIMTLANMWFYEYRVKKISQELDLMSRYISRRITKV